MHPWVKGIQVCSNEEPSNSHKVNNKFLPVSPKAKAGLGVQSLRPSVRPSIPKSCHRNSNETADPINMKLGMWIGHHM